MIHAKEAFHKNYKLFYNRLKVLGNTTVVYVKATFNDLKALKTKLNGHDGELNLLFDSDKWQVIQNNKTLNNHHFAIKMLNKVFSEYMKLWKK